MIRVAGLGPGSIEAITVGTLELLKTSKKIYLRTQKHPNVEYLRSMGIEFETFDEKYDTSENFNEVYSSIAEELVRYERKFGDITYAVPGHPLVAEKSVSLLIELCRVQNIQYEIFPAVSFIDAIMESMKIDPIEGIKVIDAFDISCHILDKRVGTVITQVYNKFIASEVKLALQDYYKDDTDIYFIRAAGVKGTESIRKIPLYEIDRQEDIDYLTSLYVPKDLNNSKDFQDLIDIMDRLRGDNGCPWDREQTHETLKRYLIEESYEVIEAIDERDDDKLVEELGDVLLQIVFHARLGKEDGYFSIKDVIQSICDKMIYRHPHIFGNTLVNDSKEVLTNWDELKKEEKGLVTYTDELKHIAKSLPALIRAEKVQNKAKKAGFDWERVEDAIDKVLEELDEVKNVYKGNNMAKILEEIGDLIFSCVNVARFLDIDPENALNYTIEKFISRFGYIERKALESGTSLEKMTLEQMDILWEEAKLKKSLN